MDMDIAQEFCVCVSTIYLRPARTKKRDNYNNLISKTRDFIIISSFIMISFVHANIKIETTKDFVFTSSNIGRLLHCCITNHLFHIDLTFYTETLAIT